MTGVSPKTQVPKWWVSCSSNFRSTPTISHSAATAAGHEGSDSQMCYGSPCDGFAINVKAVLVTCAIGFGHSQLSKFCGIFSLHNTSRKVRAVATKAVANNLRQEIAYVSHIFLNNYTGHKTSINKHKQA